MSLQVLQDAVGKVINPHFLDFGKGDIHLAVGAHLLDEGREPVADVYVLVGLVLVNLSPMGIVDNDTVSQVAALHDQHIDFLAVVIIGFGVVEELGKFGASNDALAGLVEIDAHDIAAPCLHVNALLAEWHQQVLGGEAPIKEGSHLVHRFNAHEREIAHHGIGNLGGGDRAVLAVVIDKYLDLVAHLHLGCEVSLGKQHLVCVIVDEVSTEINSAVDA